MLDNKFAGQFTGEASRVLGFLFKGIALCRRSDSKSVSYESLMHSLDRMILYLLSRPIDNVHGILFYLFCISSMGE